MHSMLTTCVGAGGELLGDLHRLVGFGGVGHLAGEDEAVVGRLDLHVGVRDQPADGLRDRAEVLIDADVEGQDAAAGAVEEGGVGGAGLQTHHIDAPRRAEHGVRDLRIGHQHIARVDRQVDDRRLALGDRNDLRNCRWRGRRHRRRLGRLHLRPRGGRRGLGEDGERQNGEGGERTSHAELHWRATTSAGWPVPEDTDLAGVLVVIAAAARRAAGV